MNDIVGILLAAGSAQRYGAHKLVQSLADGTPVGVAAASALVEVLPHSLAVVRPDDHSLIEALSAIGLQVVENPIAGQGMGTSLAAGVSASEGASGWLIALADMPWINKDSIQMLALSLREGASMVAPVHRGQRGHPVGFSRRWGSRLRALNADEGARNLVIGHAGELVLHDTDDEGVLLDIDQPRDLLRQHRNVAT